MIRYAAAIRNSLGTPRSLRVLAMLMLLFLSGGAAFAQGKYTPGTLTIEQIDKVIAGGVKALYGPQLDPAFTFRPTHVYHSFNWNVRYEVGHQALACWALLDAGESYQNPLLLRRLNWVLSRDSPNVYDRAMRAQMLAELPTQRWGPWIRRDAIWLTSALTDMGNFDDRYTGGAPKGYGDNANGQYGVLGLWGSERGNYRISDADWKKIDAYWRGAQDPKTGAWSLLHPKARESAGSQNNDFSARISGPMTAGAVSSLILTERALRGGNMTGLPKPGEDFLSAELHKGISWLDNNFTLNDQAEESDWFYYMWAMQNVGRATGYRTFNGVDWIRDVTARIMNEQRGDGSWTGPKGTLLSTSFALMYLSRSYDPLAISKVRFSGRWNNRPHDIWNFVDYISSEYEYSTTWQIAELSLPAYTLIESPLLYLATDEPFELSDTEISNLRDYINAGGLLVINPEAGLRPDMVQAIKKLVSNLFPGRTLEDVEKNHPLYSIHQRISPKTPMQMVSNGVRPLLICFKTDIGKGLQANNWNELDSFVALSNLYLYVTGMDTRRARLGNNYVVQAVENPTIPLPVARIKHSGTYNPEPGSLNQLKAMLANDHGIDMTIEELGAEELSTQKLAFLTTIGDGTLSNAEARAVSDWVQRGGTVWIDACGGGKAATESARDILEKIAPNVTAIPLSSESPLISGRGLRGGQDIRRVRWRYYALRRMGPIATPRLQVVEIDDRPAIIYSAEDITSGLAGLDHWGIFGYTVESARKMAINVALLAVSNRTPVASR